MRPELVSRAALVTALSCGFYAVACRQDMHDQHKLEPLEASAFFADGQGARLPPEHTVARGQLREDRSFYTGLLAPGRWVEAPPVPLDASTLSRGRERYDIFCSPCHDRVGTGQGMIVRRGFKQPPSLHEGRLRALPVGYFVDVVNHGFATMPSYASQIPAADRWAIALYVRALQLSQHAPLTLLAAGGESPDRPGPPAGNPEPAERRGRVGGERELGAAAAAEPP